MLLSGVLFVVRLAPTFEDVELCPSAGQVWGIALLIDASRVSSVSPSDRMEWFVSNNFPTESLSRGGLTRAFLGGKGGSTGKVATGERVKMVGSGVLGTYRGHLGLLPP